MLKKRGGKATATESEWVGGRLVTPMFITGGEPYRVELIVWLEIPEGLVVGLETLDPKAPVAFAETLVRTMRAPAVGAPRRPKRVRVADRVLAAELRSALPDIEVMVAPTSELDAVLEHMIRSMPQGDDEESYLEDGRVSPELVARLFRAAELVWRLAPWKIALDGQVLRVDIPQLDVNGACLSIIGNLGESFGLLLFPSDEAFDAFASAAEPQSEAVLPDFGTTFLALNFDRGADVPASMRREVGKFGWPVAGPNAYPSVVHRDRDGVPRPLVERDVRIMTAVATSFGAFFAKHREMFKDDEPELVSESYFDEEDLEVRFTVPYEALDAFEIESTPKPIRRAETKVGRNALCPCGSGLKHKKCCLGKEELVDTSPREADLSPDERRARLHDMDRTLVQVMRAFATECFGKKWTRAAAGSVEEEKEGQLAYPWSVYHVLVDGRPIVDWFEETQPRMTASARAWLASQRRAWLSIWEVLAVEPGKGASLKDLLTGEKRQVLESTASREMEVRDAFLARVVDHDGLSVLCGLHPHPLLPQDAAEVVRRLRTKLRAKSVPIIPDKLRDEKTGRALVRAWSEAANVMHERMKRPLRLQNTDGDELLLTTDHFAFASGSEAELVQRLTSISGAEPAEAADFAQRVTFLRPGNPMHQGLDNTVFGSARLDRGSLKVQSNSFKRAEELRRQVEAACGDLIRHRAREHSDPMALVGNDEAASRSAPEDLPPEDALQVMREHKERHYATWADYPLPALAGKTPREAARTKAGRAKLDVLVKDIERAESQAPAGTRFDCANLRKTLKLEL